MQFGGGLLDLPALQNLLKVGLKEATISGDFDPAIFLTEYGIAVPKEIVSAAVVVVKKGKE